MSLPESYFSTRSSGWSLGFFDAADDDRKPFDILYWGFLGIAAGAVGEFFVDISKILGELGIAAGGIVVATIKILGEFRRQVAAFITRNIRQLLRFTAD
jgi:hypothetical protein